MPSFSSSTLKAQVVINLGIGQSYSRSDNELLNLDKYIGPIIAPEFGLTGQHRIETRVLEMGNDTGRPVRVDLNRISKQAARP